MNNPIKQNIALKDVFFVLVTDFPQLFNPITPKPLDFNIKEQLEHYYEGNVISEHIHSFLGKWTHRPAYYRAVLVWDYRFDLTEQTTEIKADCKTKALKIIQSMMSPP